MGSSQSPIKLAQSLLTIRMRQMIFQSIKVAKDFTQLNKDDAFRQRTLHIFQRNHKFSLSSLSLKWKKLNGSGP